MPTVHMYPYATIPGPVALAISPKSDGLEVDHEQCRIVATDLEVEAIEIELAASLDPSAVGSAGVDAGGDTWALMLRLVSVPSRIRRSVMAPPGVAQHDFELTLPLHELRGDVTIDVVVVLTRDIEAEDGAATAVGSVIGESACWTLVVDPIEPPPGRSIRIEWKSFKAIENGDLPDEDLFAMRMEGDPVILLNRDIDNAYEILESKGTRGAKARIRDAIFHQVLHQCWTSMIATAWSQFVEVCAEESIDGLEVLDELVGWQRTVILDWAPFLVYEANGDSTQVLTKLTDLARDSAAAAQVLVTRVPGAIQARFRTVRSFEGLVKDAQIFGGSDDDA